jgi:anti-anti-sigma factor
MDVTVEPRSDGVAVVRLVGRLDLASAEAVKQQLVQAVGSGYRQLVVDLDGVDFLDSSGLGALIGGLKVARVARGNLRIARPNDQVRLVLELTTLDRVLYPYGTVEEALAG